MTDVQLIDGCIVRVARKGHPCDGDGSSSRRHADNCSRTIWRGDQYVEYVGATPAYQSGSRHSLACAHAFYAAPADARSSFEAAYDVPGQSHDV